jgi:hypothetical protein
MAEQWKKTVLTIIQAQNEKSRKKKLVMKWIPLSV